MSRMETKVLLVGHGSGREENQWKAVRHDQ